MSYRDLCEFMAKLEDSGQLVRIREELNPELEISEVTSRVTREGGPALFFERVADSHIPVVTNVFGSMERMKMALGSEDLDRTGQQVADFITAWRHGLGTGNSGIESVSKYKKKYEKLVDRAPCQEIVLHGNDVDLGLLPALKCWPGDAGPAINLPLVFTRDPESGVRNVGIYRLQIFDRKSTGIHWHGSKGGAGHYRSAEKRRCPLEVAVAIGPDPVMTYSAAAPLPDGLDEVVFAGFLRQSPVEMTRCMTIGMEVPTASQIVLEGRVFPDERRLEGPYGNHTGYYSPPEKYPVFHVECMTMRKKPVYPATVPGPPPQEDCFIAKATERLFLPWVRRDIPGIIDVSMPIQGIFNNIALVSIDKQSPGQAQRILNRLWENPGFRFFRIICIFDKDVDISDMDQVLWRIGNNIDPERDVYFRMALVNPF